MRVLLSLLVFIAPTLLVGQDDYRTQTRAALRTMWKYQGTDSTGFDTVGYRLALSRYEAAFTQFPDSIEAGGLYKASVLAGELGTLDTAFDYLNALLEITKDDTQNFRYIIGPYGNSDYRNLITDPRWQALVRQAESRRDTFYADLRSRERELLSGPAPSLDTSATGGNLYRQIRNFEGYGPKSEINYTVSLPINDSTVTSYLVHLPPGYDPDKAYPVLVFLHGAVRANRLTDYVPPEHLLDGWNRFYTQYADSLGVILVFPKGSEEYNWMRPDAGFFMVPTIIRQLKEGLNIDDDKVFVTGHSNGGTGSFSYLMKQPTVFAGFYGFNTYPKVFTGGTFAENAVNRSFLNFSTDLDYYYPPTANDSLSALMHRLGVDYRDVRFTGFPHWFPKFDESEAAYQLLFEDLARRERDPFPERIVWEFDDEAYGSIDWVTDIRLDTLAARADWHRPINFPIAKWLEYDGQDSLVAVPVDRRAFDLPKRPGKLRATYSDNEYRLKTSRIAGLTILLSPEMVDLDEPVRVYVNGVLKFDGRIDYDKVFMLETFAGSRDRERVWVKGIRVGG